jgi:hypothetical protein
MKFEFISIRFKFDLKYLSLIQEFECNSKWHAMSINISIQINLIFAKLSFFVLHHFIVIDSV